MARASAVQFSRTANAIVQNEINISIIFNYLRERGSAYRAQISRDLTISAPAVSRAIEKLMERGYVVETEPIRTASGKRAVTVSLNVAKGCVIGIDLLKEHLRIGLFDYSGVMIDSCSGMRFAESADAPRDLVREIEQFLDRAGTRRRESGVDRAPELKAICIGVPAIVEATSARLTSAVLFPNLSDLNLKQILCEHFHVPVYVENDVDLSALAENQYGQGRRHHDLVFVEVSAGIGAGIIIDNNLVRGINGASGELGYMVFGPDDLGRTSKTKGPLEQRASTEAMRELAHKAIAENRPTVMAERARSSPDGITPALVCSAALEGDEVACEIVSSITLLLSAAIVNLIVIINPEIVVLGGEICGFAGFETLILDPIREAVRMSVPFQSPEIVISSLGEDAGVIGAAHMAIETLLLGKYPYRI
ncbi:MAG: ROK family transcriptional regulator [Spirochaetaceae bacterium]|nr:MAG: ROK family transcriptional regulator [Spirochaetaceae bacterium]